LLFQNTDNLVPIKKSRTVQGEESVKKTGSRAPVGETQGRAQGAKAEGENPKRSRQRPVPESWCQQVGCRSPGANPKRPILAAARTASLKKPWSSDALDDMKALEIKVLDVRGLTDVADTMVIASGTSDRHVRSVAKNVVEKTKQAGFRPHGVEGQQDSDWVLIDLHDMIVHVMLPRVREFYGLEKLWDMTATKRAARA
jgi:ribosome-associated protein